MRWLTSSILIIGFSLSAQAQTLDMPEMPLPEETATVPEQAEPQTEPQPLKAQTPSSYSVNLPGRGMSMTDVEKRFGEPVTKVEEVGQPPITRWIYNDFTVFFEYQYVIHSLATHPAR